MIPSDRGDAKSKAARSRSPSLRCLATDRIDMVVLVGAGIVAQISFWIALGRRAGSLGGKV